MEHTIKNLIKYGKDKLKNSGVEDETIKIKLVLSHLIGCSKEYLFIHEEEKVEEDIATQYYKIIEKLQNGIPVQYITNHQEFMKLNFYVDENVLIPRPDTEILVEEIISICNKEGANILDLCTGSGAIAVSLSKYIPKANIYASDISQEAIVVAKKNNEIHNTNVEYIQSDLFEKIENMRI